MPVFEYEAINAAGQAVKDRLQAPSAADALTKIRTQGYYPTRVREAASKTTKATPQGSGGQRKSTGGLAGISFGRVSTTVLAEFTRQLSTLQDAGLPLVRSLKILWQQEKPGILKTSLAALAQEVEDGATLSEAMAHHPRAFNTLYVNMVQAGETGGVLDVILQRLAEFLEKAQKLRRRVIGAMIYPSAVIFFAGVIVLGIMMFVVPKFQEIFRDFRTTMPGLTVALLSIANFLCMTTAGPSSSARPSSFASSSKP